MRYFLRFLHYLLLLPLLAVLVSCASSTQDHDQGAPAAEPFVSGPLQADLPATQAGTVPAVRLGVEHSPVIASPSNSAVPTNGRSVVARGEPRMMPARFDEDLGAYLIGPQDLLKVEVFEVEELSSTVRVNRRGRITMPLIGSISVTGHNITEVERLIEQRLAEEYLQDPHVAVFVEEFASQKVTVEGSVQKAGVFVMEGRTTLLQAIAMAGGVSDVADTDQIFVFRDPYEGNRLILEFDLDDIEDGKVPDPLLKGTDIVVVGVSSARRLLKDVTGALRGFVGFGTIPL